MTHINSFNSIINNLNSFWENNGCVILQPYDSEMGAGTFHPATFFNSFIGHKFRGAYTQMSKRPCDIKYNDNSNKSSIFHQYQVIIKPACKNIETLYLLSLKKIGINIITNEIKFIEDNWKSPTLGASGIGWEVRLNGVEITQFTYFQHMGGIECAPVMVEITYGLERLALHLQNITDINKLIYNKTKFNTLKYGDLFSNYEKDYANYVSNNLNITFLLNEFNMLEKQCNYLLNKNLFFLAYDYIIKLSHIFNLIDSNICYGFIKHDYISRIRYLVNKIAIKVKKNE